MYVRERTSITALVLIMSTVQSAYFIVQRELKFHYITIQFTSRLQHNKLTLR
jgi:hypothetical protein